MAQELHPKAQHRKQGPRVSKASVSARSSLDTTNVPLGQVRGPAGGDALGGTPGDLLGRNVGVGWGCAASGRGGALEASLHRKPGLQVPSAGAARPGSSSGPRRGCLQRTHRGPRLLRRRLGPRLGPHLGRPLTPGPNSVWPICPTNREAPEVLGAAQSVSWDGELQCV